MKVAYIAGPFTAENAWERKLNVMAAKELGMRVAEHGVMPMIPHGNTEEFEGTLTPAFWYEGTLELMHRCDAVVVVEDWEHSEGTQREVAMAAERGIPVFQSGDSKEWIGFISWAESQRETQCIPTDGD